MDADTSEAIRGVHDRVDKIIDVVAETAANQKTLTRDVDRLAKSIEQLTVNAHGTPCGPCQQNAKDIAELKKAQSAINAETVQFERNTKRDWLKMGQEIIKGIALAVAGALAAWYLKK